MESNYLFYLLFTEQSGSIWPAYDLYKQNNLFTHPKLVFLQIPLIKYGSFWQINCCELSDIQNAFPNSFFSPSTSYVSSWSSECHKHKPTKSGRVSQKCTLLMSCILYTRHHGKATTLELLRKATEEMYGTSAAQFGG